MQVGQKIGQRSELHAWRQFLSRSTLWLGVWLLGAAVICWVAANWESLTKTQRFVAAESLLAVCTVAAAWLGWRLRGAQGVRRYSPDALLALAGLLLGALLALLGQTYQTGADTWELFAWWGVLLAPWAFVAMSQAVWLLWMAVVNIGLVLYLTEHGFFWWGAVQSGPVLGVALVNLLFLGGWEVAAKRWDASTLVGPRVLVAWLLHGVVGTLFFDNMPLYGLGSVLSWLWIAMTVGLGIYYQRGRRDLVVLAMLAAGVIVMSLRVVGQLGLDLLDESFVALMLAVMLMGESVWAVRWLRSLASQSAPGKPVHPVDTANPPSGSTPWYVQGVLAFSAWLSTWLVLLFLVGAGVVMSTATAAATGGILCVLAVFGFRQVSGLFGRQCVTALGFAGQLLVAASLLLSQYGFSQSFGVDSWLYVLLLGAIMYALAPETLLRFLSASMMAVALGTLMVQTLVADSVRFELLKELLDLRVMGMTTVWLPVAVTGAWVAAIAFYLGYYPALDRSRSLPGEDSPSAMSDEAAPALGSSAGDLLKGAGFGILRPLAWAFALLVQAMVWMAGGLSIAQLPGLWQANVGLAIVMVAGVVLPAVCAMAVLWPRRHALTSAVVWGVPLGLLALALFWLPSPGIAFALAWLLLGFGVRDLRWIVMGGISLLGYLLVYYYQLAIPLLDKAFWLAGAALLLFVLRGLVYFVPRWMRTIDTPVKTPPAPVSAALRWRTGVVVGGLALVLAAVNYTIWQREMLLAQGRTILLELAPVDPRSLMQGDYMALRFAAGEALRPRFGDDISAAPDDGYVVLAPDGQGVAKVVRNQAGVQPLTGGEMALRYRIRRGDVRIVTNAYFFPEGRASHYAKARYGEVRVGEDGTGLLVRMLDEDRQPL